MGRTELGETGSGDGKQAIEGLSARYPQLLLPIQQDERLTPEYRAAVLRGKPLSGKAAFLGDPRDCLSAEDTPAGRVELLVLGRREDFEHALRALAYRCEPVEIPASVGASTVRGLINWEKIREHRRAYLAAGGSDWAGEFRRFTAEKRNYLDTLILLSRGEYSALPARAAGLEREQWLEKSLVIRKYHELTHFVCRELFPGDVDPVRDEILADLIGLVAAFGDYDPTLARRFLGIEGERCRPEGRLSHYVDPASLPEAAERADRLIDRYAAALAGEDKSRVFPLLLRLFCPEEHEKRNTD